MNDQNNVGQKEETDGHPLGSIALSLSGGGGRAAGYHLGTLAYLDRVDLLKDVSILSSVSGGSVIAAKYALTLKTAPEEEPLHDTFRRFYKQFFGFCMHSNLVGRISKKLGTPSERHPGRQFRRRKAVMAVADIYDESEDCYNRARFDVFWDPREIHIKDLIINATEFKTGQNFRFHKSRDRRRSGSHFVPLPESWARKARLADIVAASSCIPVGMEPIFFPQDFRWPEDEPKLCSEIEGYIAYHCGSDAGGNKVKSVSLMDGGVYDNQGTDSVAIALAEQSYEDLERADVVASRFIHKYDEIPIVGSLGVLIISDTPLLNDNIYPAPAEEDAAGSGAGRRLTLGHLNRMMQGLMVLALAMVALNVRTLVSDIRRLVSVVPTIPAEFNQGVWDGVMSILEGTETTVWEFVGSAMPVIVGSVLLIVLLRLRSQFITFLSESPETNPVERAKLDEKRAQGGRSLLERRRLARRRWKTMRGIRVSALMEMVGLRLSSTWALTSTIFLNRIRSLGYSMLENRDDVKDRLIKNEIYDIVVHRNKASRYQPSAQMLAVAQRAASMETALWYDDDDQLKDLVACGQFTICHNLLEYIDKPRAGGEDQGQKAALYKKLEGDWEILNENPFALIDELERSEGGDRNKDSSTGRPNVETAKA